MNDYVSNIFLLCFVFGFAASVISLLMGGGEHHMFDGGHGAGHGVHGHIGADGASTGGHHAHGGHGHGHHHGDSGDGGSARMPFFSLTGLLMFLTWFGGVGFALSRFSLLGLFLVLVAAVLAGLLGSSAIYLFYNRILLAGETPMRPQDYHMPGTLARITSGIREGGTGEIVYLQGGTRKTAGARSDEGAPHPRGQEVVIVRYDRGIAYVRALDPFLGRDGDEALTGPEPKEV